MKLIISGYRVDIGDGGRVIKMSWFPLSWFPLVWSWSEYFPSSVGSSLRPELFSRAFANHYASWKSSRGTPRGLLHGLGRQKEGFRFFFRMDGSIRTWNCLFTHLRSIRLFTSMCWHGNICKYIEQYQNCRMPRLKGRVDRCNKWIRAYVI